MTLPTLTDTEADAILTARITALMAEVAQHQANALAQGDELDAAITAHTAASTVETRARLRAAKAALAATAAAITTITDAAKALDRIADGDNSAQRLRARANQAIAAAAAVVVADEATT